MITTDILYLYLAFIASFIMYPYWIDIVYKLKLGEQIRVDGPQTHLLKAGTPGMGGFIFILTVAVVTLLFNQNRHQTLFPVFIACMAGLLGLLEDFVKVYKVSGLRELFNISLNINFSNKNAIVRFLAIPWIYFVKLTDLVGSSSGRGIKTYQKFLVQGGISGFVAYWTYIKLGWDYFWLPLIGDVHVGVLYPIIIFFMFIAVFNFVAFTDGIDGLAGGLGIIALSAYWVIASQLEYNSIAAYTATFIGAMIPFMYFNIYPARVFMGDVGSYVLGATLALLAVVLHREVAMFFILAVFLADGISSPLQQFSVKLTGKRLFRMAPMHHHFELAGWPETKVTMRFWLFGAIFSFIGIFIALL